MKANAYLVDVANGQATVLLELFENNSNDIVNYYYELYLNMKKGEDVFIKGLKEIYDPLLYIHSNFSDKNIVKRKLTSDVTNEILKIIGQTKYAYLCDNYNISNSYVNEKEWSNIADYNIEKKGSDYKTQKHQIMSMYNDYYENKKGKYK